MSIKLSAFNFELPDNLIASYPTKNREDARLMVVDRKLKTVEHFSFKDFPKFFEEGDALVLNDSQVFNGLLYGKKEKVPEKIEVLFLRELNKEDHLWDAWINPARKMRISNKLHFGGGLIAEVIDNTTSRGRTLKFLFDGDSDTLKGILRNLGKIPLPKELKRKTERLDINRYQNVYAKTVGSIAPPSAGFHFSHYLLKYLEAKGIRLPTITLHLSLSSFKTVNVEDFNKYRMHTEYYAVPEKSASTVNKALAQGKQVCAVGTSTFKVLESAISHNQDLQAGTGWTSNFIHPPYQPQNTSRLLTGFHLPRSIGFVNTLAFAGLELAMEAYKEAIQAKYRFFVYGDALLII